ncbi:MAG TPA: integration host factor subunit alpha [Acidobacteriota bacterium]|nr:integration host factor subunit alpha [Acidobacteriota bacterium]HRR57334.1 integration host factor subunit alpha [Acidobacteriota bacterium]HRV09083.1 integration host factor subunit alpha [Acidobacteriota bacterium]
MIKADLAQLVRDTHGGISYQEALRLVDTTLDILKETLARHEDVKLTGFGTFSVRCRRSRLGRNPQTGERIELPAGWTIAFRPSRLLRF